MNSAIECPVRFKQLAGLAQAQSGSDIHLAVGQVPYLRVGGEIRPLDSMEFNVDSMVVDQLELNELIEWMIGKHGLTFLESRGSFDGAVAVQLGRSVARFRFNIFRSQSKPSIALRLLDERFRTLDELGLPERLDDICDLKDGLVLVAGPTGSGKSTTLATLIDRINQRRAAHIVTIEDPIEYLHPAKRSLVSQRQVGLDTPDFNRALLDALRQDPDVVLVGELRELVTIRTAISAAETGHLVFATVHAGDAVGALERLVSVFPGNEQAMINQMLATTLQAVIIQHLLPARTTAQTTSTSPACSGRILASEVLRNSSAVSNLISSGNFNQIRSVLETSGAFGMYTLDSNLAKLYRAGKIDQQVAISLARNPKMLMELAKAVYCSWRQIK